MTPCFTLESIREKAMKDRTNPMKPLEKAMKTTHTPREVATFRIDYLGRTFLSIDGFVIGHPSTEADAVSFCREMGYGLYVDEHGKEMRWVRL